MQCHLIKTGLLMSKGGPQLHIHENCYTNSFNKNTNKNVILLMPPC